jgi:RNA recognition motif-containing protein
MHFLHCYVIQVLFLKNLHHKVTEDDLLAVFGSCVEQERSEGGERRGQGGGDRSQTGPPSVRVMSGRMKGQAFVEFHSESPVVS